MVCWYLPLGWDWRYKIVQAYVSIQKIKIKNLRNLLWFTSRRSLVEPKTATLPQSTFVCCCICFLGDKRTDRRDPKNYNDNLLGSLLYHWFLAVFLPFCRRASRHHHLHPSRFYVVGLSLCRSLSQNALKRRFTCILDNEQSRTLLCIVPHQAFVHCKIGALKSGQK